MPYGAKSSVVGKMMKGSGKAFPGALPSFDGQDPEKPGYSSNPGYKLDAGVGSDLEVGNEYAEGHETAVDLYENAMQDLQQLAEKVPEVARVAARLEALWNTVKASDDGAQEVPEPEETDLLPQAEEPAEVPAEAPMRGRLAGLLKAQAGAPKP